MNFSDDELQEMVQVIAPNITRPTDVNPPVHILIPCPILTVLVPVLIDVSIHTLHWNVCDRLYLQEADIDGDQHVSFEEFSNIFNEG